MNIQVSVYEDEDTFVQTAALFKVREVSHCSLLFTLIKKNNNTFTHHKITQSFQHQNKTLLIKNNEQKQQI